MLLSIIIPCHNLENWIQPCLTSLLAQKTQFKYELIFIFDACADNTEDIVRAAFQRVNFRVRYLRCDYANLGKVRNLGLQQAKGEYIWFIDGDDWLLDSAAIEKIMLSFINDLTIDAVRFDYETVLKKHYSYIWQYVFHRDFIREMEFEEVALFESDSFAKTFMNKRPRFHTMNEKLYFYLHPREGSLLTEYKKSKQNT